MYMFAAIIRRRSRGEDVGRSTVALPPCAPAAASESSEAKLSSFAAREMMMASGRSKASGSTSGSGISSTTTAYTSSRDSALSSELDLQLQCIVDDEEQPKRLERAKHLAKEFCHGDGDIASRERRLSDMGIGWVLDLADDPPEVMTSLLRSQPQRDNLTDRWIRSLTELTESIRLMYLQCFRVVRAEGRFVMEPDVPGRVQLLRIVEATFLRMLPFVDALLVATDLDASTDTAGVTNGEQAPSEKLQALLFVSDALSRASEGIPLYFQWDSSAELKTQRSKLLSLLSEKEHRLEEAIWNTIEEVRTNILSDGDDNNEWVTGIQTSKGSPDICKVTQSLVTYIKSLWNNYSRLNDIVRAAEELGSYVPNRDIVSSFHLSAQQVKTNPLTTLALEMVSSLEVKLSKRSESLPDRSLRFLFLINNTHFILQQLRPLSCTLKYHIAVLAPKIEGYIQEYLQLSWAPIMSCLNNDTPHCFRKNSALPKFDSEFEKTYTAQKLWKVPDPELRTRLRKDIVEEVIPGLTGFLEVNNITSPAVYPQERKEMLLELFEG